MHADDCWDDSCWWTFWKVHGRRHPSTLAEAKFNSFSFGLQAGKHKEVVALMEAQGWWERLAEFANNLDARQDIGGLRAAAAAFSRADRLGDAEACLRRLGNAEVHADAITREKPA